MRFVSIRVKFFRYCIALGLSLLFFILVTSMMTRYFFRRGDLILQQTETYTQFWTQLDHTRRCMYSYVQSPSGPAREEAKELLSRLLSSVRVLTRTANGEELEDLFLLEEKYRLYCEEALLEGTADPLTPYQSSERIHSELTGLKANFDAVMNAAVNRQRTGLLSLRRRVLLLSVLTGAGMFLLFLWYTRVISRNMMAPIERLTSQSLEIIEGNRKIPLTFRDHPRDELEVLTNVFCRMVETNDRQMRELKEKAELEKSLAQTRIDNANLAVRLNRTSLRLLQSRVNPHFMFNMLNIIAGLALDENAEKTMQLTLKAAKYLRYSLVSLDKVVTLRQEFENVRLYLAIQEERFPDRLRFSFFLPPECEDLRLPSMVLQPLCENAILHGMAPITRPVLVSVTAWREGGYTWVQVADDGAGMPEETLLALRGILRSPLQEYDDSGGIGVANTFQRIQMHFQEAALCEADSLSGRGTQIRFGLPEKSSPSR